MRCGGRWHGALSFPAGDDALRELMWDVLVGNHSQGVLWCESMLRAFWFYMAV